MRLVISHDQQLAVLDGAVRVEAGDPIRSPDTIVGPCFGCALSSDGGHICPDYDLEGTITRCGRASRKDGRTIVWQRV